MCITYLLETLKERPLGRCERVWEDNIKVKLKGLAYEGVDRIHLAEERSIGGRL
jgi:hypothetical protein